MPIYAYKCSSCGHGADVMQKLADAPLTVCPACGQPHFTKQITAAGFQLKGSGWYATDFKDGAKGAKKESTDATAGKKEATDNDSSTNGKKETAASQTGDKPASDAAKSPAAPAGGSGGASCT